MAPLLTSVGWPLFLLVSLRRVEKMPRENLPLFVCAFYLPCRRRVSSAPYDEQVQATNVALSQRLSGANYFTEAWKYCTQGWQSQPTSTPFVFECGICKLPEWFIETIFVPLTTVLKMQVECNISTPVFSISNCPHRAAATHCCFRSLCSVPTCACCPPPSFSCCNE